MSQHLEIGKTGEELAKTYLESKGYLILETNWRFKHLEVDIIAKKDNALSIVEVKTRSSKYAGEPYLAVDKQKQKLLFSAANAYIERKNIDVAVQFDIISIVLSGQTHTIEHIEDAFSPQW